MAHNNEHNEDADTRLLQEELRDPFVRNIVSQSIRKAKLSAGAEQMARSPQVAQEVIESMPVTEHRKKQLKDEVVQGTPIIQSIKRGETKLDEGQERTPKESLASTVAMFLPTLIGGVAGAAFEGTQGAAAALEGGLQGTATGLTLAEKLKKLREDKKKVKTPTKISTINDLGKPVTRIVDGQTGETIKEFLTPEKEMTPFQKANLRFQKMKTKGIMTEKEMRREERQHESVIKAKNFFAKSATVENIKEQSAVLDDMEDIINDAPEIAVGVIPFKIAKGIAGEVGNLNIQELESAQISPSFIRNLKRKGAKFLTGRLPEEDVKELAKLTKAIKKNLKKRLTKEVKNFAASRTKSMSPELAKTFEADLLLEHGLTPADINEEQNKPSTKSIEQMSSEERQRRIQEISKKLREGK